MPSHSYKLDRQKSIGVYPCQGISIWINQSVVDQDESMLAVVMSTTTTKLQFKGDTAVMLDVYFDPCIHIMVS